MRHYITVKKKNKVVLDWIYIQDKFCSHRIKTDGYEIIKIQISAPIFDYICRFLYVVLGFKLNFFPFPRFFNTSKFTDSITKYHWASRCSILKLFCTKCWDTRWQDSYRGIESVTRSRNTPAYRQHGGEATSFLFDFGGDYYTKNEWFEWFVRKGICRQVKSDRRRRKIKPTGPKHKSIEPENPTTIGGRQAAKTSLHR